MVKKEFKVNYFKSVYFQISVVLVILNFYILYRCIKDHTDTRIVFIFLFFALLPAVLFLYSFSKILLILQENVVFLKLPYKTATINFKDIYKIERVLGWGQVNFYIYYKENGKKRTIGFPDQVQGYQEILDYLEQKTGLKVKWGL